MTIVFPEISRPTASSHPGPKTGWLFEGLIEKLHGDRCIQAAREIRRYRYLLADNAPHLLSQKGNEAIGMPIDLKSQMPSSRTPTAGVDDRTIPTPWSPTKMLIVFCVAIFGLLHVFGAILMQRPSAEDLPDRFAFMRNVE